jgi:hypothetical protein
VAEPKKKPSPASAPQVSINLDKTPILYTDNVIVTGNKDGVVLDFCQRVGNQQLRVVARVGMSRNHAKKLLMVLKDQIDRPSGRRQTGKKTVN